MNRKDNKGRKGSGGEGEGEREENRKGKGQGATAPQIWNSVLAPVYGDALIVWIAMEVCIFIKVTNVINHANFNGRMLGGLVCAN
jgi:hypothetical protein